MIQSSIGNMTDLGEYDSLFAKHVVIVVNKTSALLAL